MRVLIHLLAPLAAVILTAVSGDARWSWGRAPPLPQCCPALPLRQQSLLLTSPGLPHSASASRHCSYEILRSSPAVCRLRLRLVLFALPPPDAHGRCRQGYLRVGRCQLCGCRSGAELVVPFIGDRMDIELSLPGDDPLAYSGFVIEMSQEGRHWTKEKRQAWQPIASLPYRQGSAYDNLGWYSRPAAVSGALSAWHHRPQLDDRCGAEPDWLLWTSRSTCGDQTCADVTPSSAVNGSGLVVTPGYPDCLPTNVDSCYRIPLSNGSCSTQFTMEDFDLPVSESCKLGYVQLEDGGEKHCGNSLQSKTWTSENASSVVRIVSSPRNADRHRGFKLRYRHLPCCGGELREGSFRLSSDDLPAAAHYNCSWLVLPFSKSACELQLEFEKLQIPCGAARLNVGSIPLCGDRSGQSVRLELTTEGISVNFWRSEEAKNATWIILGRQVEDCEPFELDVPIQ